MNTINVIRAVLCASANELPTGGSAVADAPETLEQSEQLQAVVGAPGDELPEVDADASPEQKEIARLQRLLRSTQEALVDATTPANPAEPISDEELKPLFAEHIRTGVSIGKWLLTDSQKASWKLVKAERAKAINGRVMRQRIMKNVERAANEGGFARYRERVSEKTKKLAGFTLGAKFAMPKKAKADKPQGTPSGKSEAK